MDPLIALLALLLVASARAGSGWLAYRGLNDILTAILRSPDLGWPHCVQEEDPAPRNWAASHPEPAVEHVEPHPQVAPLAAHVGRGLARKGRW
jgi:hypothetical protein